MNESEYSYDFSEASHIKSVQPEKIQDFCQSIGSRQHQEQIPIKRKSTEIKQVLVIPNFRKSLNLDQYEEKKNDNTPKFDYKTQNCGFKLAYHSHTQQIKSESLIPIQIEKQINQRQTAGDQIHESRAIFNLQNQGNQTRDQVYIKNITEASEPQKVNEVQDDSSSESDHGQKYANLDEQNDELFDTINSQIKEDFKYMMIVLFPFLLVQIFFVQLANCVDTLLGLRQIQDIKLLEHSYNKQPTNYIDSLNFYIVLVIMISIHVTYVSFYAIIAFQIYKKSRLFQKFVKAKANKIYVGNNFEFQEKNESYQVLSGIICFLVIIFQDSILYELLIKFQFLNSQNSIYSQNNMMENIFEKLFYILVCYSFRKHCNCSFWKFMILYQILFLSKVLRISGWIAFKDILQEDFWMKDDISFIKIIFGYQILFTQYRCWVQSLIHKQKIIQNKIQPFETLYNQIKVSIIQKFNQKFEKNGFIEQLHDFDFLGSYTKICNSQKNRKKTNLVQQEKISKRMLQKSNSSIQIGLDMYDNLCTCLLKIFVQIAENISVPPQTDDLKRHLKDFNLHKDELLQNFDYFEEKFKSDFCMNLQTAVTKNKLSHNKFSNIKSLSFSNFLKLQSNQFNEQMIDEEFSLEDFLKDNKNIQKIQHFYQQDQKVLIKIEKIEFDKNLYLLQFQIFQKNDKIQINIHDKDAVGSPRGESLESKRLVRPIEIEIMNRTLSSMKMGQSNGKKMRNRSHKSHQNIQSFVQPLIIKQNIQQNILSSRQKEKDEQHTQKRGFSFGSADYIDYDYAIQDKMRQNKENKSQQHFHHQNSLLQPNKQINQKIDIFNTDENKKILKNSSCSDSSIEASPKYVKEQNYMFKKQHTNVSFQDDSVQQNDSFYKSGLINSSEVNEQVSQIINKQRRKTLERGKSHIVEKNENVHKMINYIDQSDFNQEAISETNKKKELKQKLQVNGKQRKLLRQKTQTIQHKKKCSKKSMADQVLKMMKDEQEKKELLFLKQLEYQIEQQIESNQNSQVVQSSKFKQSQKKLQQYLIKGVHLTPDIKASNNQLQSCQNIDSNMKMLQTFQEQLQSLKIIIQQKEQILNQKQQIQDFNEQNLSKKNNRLKNLINSREIDLQKDNQSKNETHFTLNQSILNNKFNAKSQTLKQLIEFYENKIEQKQAALEFFKNKTKNLQQSLDSNKIFLNMAVHDMRNPTNQVEFLVSESLKSLKEIQKLNQEMQQLKIQNNQEQIQNPVQIISMGQIQNQQVLIGEQREKIFKRELIIEEEEKVFKQEDEIQMEVMHNNQQQNHLRSNFQDQQFKLNLQNQQPAQNFQQQMIDDQQPKIKQESDQLVKQEEIKRNSKLNSIHHKFQKDDKRKNIVKKQQIKAQIFKDKKRQNALFSIKRMKSELYISNSQNSDFDHSQKSNLNNLEKSLNYLVAKNMQRNSMIDLKKEKKILERKQVENKINQMGVIVQSIKINEQDISLQKKQFFQNFNQQQKSNKNNIFILNDHSNYLFPKQNQEKIDKKNFAQNLKDNFNHVKFQIWNKEENEDFEFNEEDQEPYITREKAEKMHLSHDRYLLFLNQQKDKKYLKCELQKLSRKSGLCNIQIKQLKNLVSRQSQTDEDNTLNEVILSLQNQNSQLISQFELYETQIGQKLQVIENNFENLINKLQNCKYCSTMLLNLINDMMDLAKSEKMKFELNCEFFDLTKTIERAFDTLSYFKEQKNITTHFIIDKNIEPFFQNFKGDENRFSQIFLNFLSNAFKFTSQNGTIWMEVCQNGDQEFCQKIFPSKDLVLQNQNVLELLDQSQIDLNQKVQTKVEQNQIEDSKSMIEEYYISFQVRIKDSGMGIAKENLGKLFLNFGKLQDTQGCNKQGTGLGLSICKHIIEKMGGKVHVESDGIGTGTTFVITMQAISKIDINILNNSENQLFFQIDKSKKESSSQKFNNQILIEQKEKILKDQKEALKEAHIIQNIQIEPQVNEAKKDVKSMKVLVINDEFFILQMLTMMVKQTEITDIDTAQNGFDGFNMVKTKQYDFILCDLNMPVMDGFECIQKIKEHYQECNSFFERSSQKDTFCPYLVACSAFINAKIEQQAISTGFELIVESPLTYKILKDTIIPNALEKYKGKKNSNVLRISNSLKHLNLSQISIEDVEIDSNSSLQIKNLIEQIDEDLLEIHDQNIKMQQQNQNDSPESYDSDSSSQMDDLSSYHNGSSNQIERVPKQRYSSIKEVDEEQYEDNDFKKQKEVVRKKESILSLQMSPQQNSSDDDNSISVHENSDLNSPHSKIISDNQKQLKKIQAPSLDKISEIQRNRMILSYNPRYQNGSQKSDRSQTDKSSASYFIVKNPSQSSVSQESIMMSIKKPQERKQAGKKKSLFIQKEQNDNSSDSSSNPLEIMGRKPIIENTEKYNKNQNNQHKQYLQKNSFENKKQIQKQVSFDVQAEDENDCIQQQMAFNKQLLLKKKPSFAEKVQIANDSFKQNQYKKVI